VTRAHPLAPHRLIVVLVVLALGLAAFGVTRNRDWSRRLAHPLNYEETIAYEAERSHLDPYLVAAVINVESGFRPSRVSKAGAVGLMQVLPSTAVEVARAPDGAKLSAKELAEPKVNIHAGVRYLARLMKRYGGDESAALAAYNAGSRHADRWTGAAGSGEMTSEIDFPVTKRYVSDVLEQRETYRELYPTAFEKQEAAK
jgi:soluble lytic murein transglycosylase